MRIYRRIDSYGDSYYFMTSRENGLFCFSLVLPDRNTLTLCPCTIGPRKEEDDVFENAVEVSNDIYKRFNSLFDKKGNYKGICRLLMDVFDVDQESLDKSFGRDDFVLDVTDRCIREYGKESSDWYYREIYQAVKSCLRIWDNDIERTVRWIVSEAIPEITSHHTAMVDIFGECHPTKRKLLYKFYSCWGKELDSVIEKSIEEYPDENDFDLATYRCRELLRKR